MPARTIPPLTAERLRELLHYDPNSGNFYRKISRGRWKAGSLVRSTPNAKGYLRVNIDGRSYRLNRLAWLYVHGHWPRFLVDHRNGIRSDNRIDNLRDATASENQRNRRGANVNSESGILGVRFVGGRNLSRPYRATVWENGKPRSLGYYETAQEAAMIAAEARRKLKDNE